MADQRGGGISWTDETWNPVRGCSRVSAGCTNCYAEEQALRITRFDRARGVPEGQGAYDGLVRRVGGEARWTGRLRLVTEKLAEPLGWKRPRRVFVNSMSDLFHEELSDADIARVFAVMALAPQHTFQVLTKRAARMRHWFLGQHRPNIDVYNAATEMLPGKPGHRDWSRMPLDMAHTRSSGGTWWPLPNVWLGVSVEDQRTADDRIPLLLKTPAAVRWVSYEPGIGPIDFLRMSDPYGRGLHGWSALQSRDDDARGLYEHRLDWIVVGGESGAGARPFDVAWARACVSQCKAAGVAVFVKQLGAHAVVPACRQQHFDWRMAAGFEAEDPLHPSTGTWRVKFKSCAGADPNEWPEDLRVREYPA